jgi:WD40 repeat protein
MAYNPENNVLITAGVDGCIVWELIETFEQKESWKAAKPVYSLIRRKTFGDSPWVDKLSIDIKNNMVFVYVDKSVRVYDAQQGVLKDELLDIHSKAVTGCLFYSRSHYYITSSKDSEIKLWSKSRGNALVHTFMEHSKAVTGILLHPHSGLLISCSLDKTVRVFEIDTQREWYYHV